MSDKDIIEECTQKLDKACAESYDKLENYYLGRQPINYIAPEVRKQVGRRLSTVHVDWPRLVLTAHEERMDVMDFRLGNEESFTEAWDVWQRNNMDEQSSMGHLDALLYGRAFVSVWVNAFGKATMRCESPKQCWFEHDPADGTVRYGIKRWFDKNQGRMLVVTPDKITTYVTKGKREEGLDISNLPPDSWVTVPNGRTDNPTGVVPFFPLVNRERILNPYGESILTEVLPLADAINKLATDMMVTAEYLAGPRRWATGVQIIEDANGNPIEPFAQVIGRTWTAEAPDARIGSLPEADLKNFIGAIDMLSMMLAAMGGIPPHYFDAAKGSLASADSIRASEASLLAGVKRAIRQFGGTWEDAMRYAISLEGTPITPDIEKMETRWKDPENQTQSQINDAAIKRKSLGVPMLQLWEDMGYSKAQIERMKRMKKKEEADARNQAAQLIGHAPPGAVQGAIANGAQQAAGNGGGRVPVGV
jgi:hypothetical protein